MASVQGVVINISDDIDAMIARLEHYERDSVPFWTANALTQTAKDIQADVIAEMARVFDRPTRFTLNAFYVKPATKTDQAAAVMFKEGFGSIPAWRYLGPQVEGGQRKHKSYERRLIEVGAMRADEFAVPGQGAKLDAHGNLTGGIWQRIMADMGFMRDALQNTTARSRKRKANRNRGRYFVMRPDGPAPAGMAGLARNVAPGIYHATGGGTVVPVIAFVRSPRYRKRLAFYEMAKATLQRNFARNFAAARSRYPARGIR